MRGMHETRPLRVIVRLTLSSFDGWVPGLPPDKVRGAPGMTPARYSSGWKSSTAPLMQ